MKAPIQIKYLWNSEDLVRAYKYHKKSSKYFWLSRFIVFGLGIVNLLFGIFGLFTDLSNNFAIFQLVIGSFLLLCELISNAVYRYRCKQLNYDHK